MRVWIIFTRPNKTNSNRNFVLEVGLFWKKKASQFYFCLSWCLIVHPYWGWRLWRTNEICFYPKRTNGCGWRLVWDTASDPAHTQFLTEASTLSSISVGGKFLFSFTFFTFKTLFNHLLYVGASSLWAKHAITPVTTMSTLSLLISEIENMLVTFQFK